MNCPKCNAANADSSKFCVVCGQPLSGSQNAASEQTNPAGQQQNSQQYQQNPSYQNGQQYQQNPQYQNGQQYQQYQKPPKEKKPLDKKTITMIAGGGGALLLILIIIIVAVVTHKNTVNLQDYMTVEFSGYDGGYGSASYSFDWDTFYTDLAKKSNMNLNVSSSSSISDLLSSMTSKKYAAFYNAYNSVSYDISPTEELSNGDTVTVVFEFNNEYAKAIGVKFKGADMEVEVEGLSEVATLDPFADVTVEFSGTSPNAYANVIVNSSESAVNEGLYYNVEPSSGIAKGETVTVTVSYYYGSAESFMEDYGYALTETTKEFVCEEVDTYITDTADLSEDVLNDMKSQAEDLIEEYFANESSDLSATTASYVGYYFLVAKNSSDYTQNKIYVIYSADVTSLEEEPEFTTTTVYLPVAYEDVIMYADGSCYVDLNDGEIEGSTDLEYGWYDSVKGYESISSMKNDLVSAQKGSYTETIVGDALQ